MKLAGVLLAVLAAALRAEAYGAAGPMSAAWGGDGFFCAIQANGRQEPACWAKGGSSSPSAAAAEAAAFAILPPAAALSGGEGFMCGLHAGTSAALCWRANTSADALVPPRLRSVPYAHIAAGAAHVCAARGSYFSDSQFGTVDCWLVTPIANITSTSSPLIKNVGKMVAGDGFTCGEISSGGFTCWGPKSVVLGFSEYTDEQYYHLLASSRDSVCGISENSGEVKCWGVIAATAAAPTGVRFVSLTAGTEHFCGIRESDHGVQCWGTFNSSAVPSSSGFLSISASDSMTCGVRESDLLLDCWGEDSSPASNYTPPLQLASPGMCTAGRCGEGEFSFNASVLNVPDLSNLCINRGLQICSPCGYNCSRGLFPSSKCGADSNRVCTACSLCQNSSCSHICEIHSFRGDDNDDKQKHWFKKMGIAIGGSVCACVVVIVIAWFVLPRLGLGLSRKGDCIRKPPETEKERNEIIETIAAAAAAANTATQAFRLSELKDATHGFKEFNELGRGSYGFVYKAVLADGRQVAVKRANAATRIRTNSRDFEAELESLCKIRHGNLVNLLGYCAEMGERLLVYEFMPHGTLYDHLHGGLSPLNWSLRLKICLQSARGLEYLHKEAIPPVVHGDVKTSNILLDAEWEARVADFGLLSSGDRGNGAGNSVYTDPEYAKTQTLTEKSDVYSFGVVLLEVLSGRKAHDKDCDPASIVEWAVPMIKGGKAAAVIDSSVELPRNVEPLLRLGEIAELAVREDRHDRPNMSILASFLDQVVKGGGGSL